ncbi:MAG: cytochrome bc complex cytochrome b subunit [Fimbriimonas sp.]|nr:cytochrome bc complex cytochrome b subunit [Fimbriimonas sp.]
MAKIFEYLDERLSITELRKFGEKKAVPLHKQSFWYYWGGISLLCFLVQIVTGVMLIIYYKPGPDAYNSVRSITYDVEFGWLIRSAHSWAATIFLVSIFVHMFSVYFMKAYRSPREFGWWSGIALLILGLLFGFSGYLLPMDQLSFVATKVGLAIPENIPVVGHAIANLMRGGYEVSEITVQRFFAWHAVVLPLIYIPLLMFHLWLVQKHGNAVPPSEEAKPEKERMTIPFFPNFLMKDLALWLVTLNVIAFFASIFPQDIGKIADPLGPAPVGIHPEWYFMSSFETLKIIGKLIPGTIGEAVGITIFTLGLVLWALIPFYDVRSLAGKRGRLATYFGLFCLAVLIVTTLLGYVMA